MKVFVTGGTGFIGSNLSRYLTDAGHHVTVFDNLSNSTRDSISGIKSDRLEFVMGDITDADVLMQASAGHDIMVHLAAQISVQRSMEHTEETMRINVDGTRNVIDACEKNRMGIIAASSAAIFGDTCGRDEKLDEDSACNPLSPYGQSKLEMERLLGEYGSSIILRFFNIYGPGQTSEYAGVISKFAGFIKNNSDVIIYGDGHQTRDFISIDDTVRAIKHAMPRIGLSPDTYNIGTGISTSVNDLAGIMLKITGSNNIIVHREQKTGDIRFARTSIQRARECMDFECKTSLEDGIKKYWNGF